MKNCKFGKNPVIEENVIIGCNPKGLKLGRTSIGDNGAIRSGAII